MRTLNEGFEVALQGLTPSSLAETSRNQAYQAPTANSNDTTQKSDADFDWASNPSSTPIATNSQSTSQAINQTMQSESFDWSSAPSVSSFSAPAKPFEGNKAANTFANRNYFILVNVNFYFIFF